MLRRSLRVADGIVADTAQAVRVEQVLATARLFLAVCSLIAVYVDPTAPTRYATLAYVLLTAYLIWSFGVFAVVVLRRRERLTRHLVLSIHTIDLCWPALLSVFTEGAESPFYLFFFFALLAAAFRWGFWETLATTLTAIFILAMEPLIAGAGSADNGHLLQGEFELNQFIMRLTYLLLIGLLMGYLGEEQRRLRTESSTIAHLVAKAQAQRGLTGTMRAVLDELMQRFGAARVVIVVQELRSGRAFLWEPPAVPHSGTWPQVTELDNEQKERWFFPTPCPSLQATRRCAKKVKPCPVVALDSNGRRIGGVACSLPESLFSSPAVRSALLVSVAFEQEWFGRVFLFKPRIGIFRERELRFLQALVHSVSPAVYNAYLSVRLRSRAGALERARVARELHDGVVQFLCALELHMEAVRQTPHAPPRMVEEVARIQHLLRQESANLRELMQRATPLDLAPAQLVSFLRDAVNRFRLETGIAASFASDVDGVLPSSRVCREVARIVQEALVNVRKHSGARKVFVRLASEGQTLRLVVSDDGKGFDFSGRLSQAELDSLHKGPAVIKDRVRSVHGELTIDSVPDRGARLEVTIPQA